MAYRTRYKVRSLKHPNKTWDSSELFWADHSDEDKAVDEVLDAYEKAGKLSQNDIIGEDKKHVIYTRTWDSILTHNEYLNKNDALIEENNLTHQFELIYEGNI
tara:strand:- start:2324 stop:2632 length:309 start_codon:yes stop_codon:yes gene_type:complete